MAHTSSTTTRHLCANVNPVPSRSRPFFPSILTTSNQISSQPYTSVSFGLSYVIIFLSFLLSFPGSLRPDWLSRWQAVGRVYGGLEVLSEKSALVGRALEYMGDILKYIKPYLVSKSQEGMQLAYWAVGG